MTHPEELLAGYVDGTLSSDERAVVDAHLASCETCRDEVALAREAVRALASLEPQSVPFGVTGPILAEAGKQHERRGAVWQRVRWATGIAAAAALVVVVGLNLVGGDDEHVRGLASGGGTAVAPLAAPDVRLERQPDVDYDGDAGVHALADDAIERYRQRAFAGISASEAPAESGSEEDSATAAPSKTADPTAALRCLATSSIPLDPDTGTLVRLLEARFSGSPAFFAVFLQGPGAGQPPDRVVVWVVSKAGCTLLNGATAKIPD
jgi:anti-sigma factor RsiW